MAGKRESLGRYQIEWVPIDSVQPHPQNPRKGNVGKIQRSIQANDFFEPCVAQRSTGNIIIGSHRWKAAKAEGKREVPVIFHSVSDKRALAMMLAGNKASDDSTYDPDGLVEVLEMFDEDELPDTLFTADELEALAGIDAGYDDVDDARADETSKRRVTECPKCAHVFVPDTFVERD